MVKASFAVREYKNKDAPAVASLWQKAGFVDKDDFSCDLTSYIRWKYSQYPFAGKSRIWLCESGSQLAGTCGVMARPLFTGRGRILGLWGMDALTDLPIRNSPGGKYVFFKVYRKALLGEFRKGNKETVHFCFPDKGIADFYLKTGWIDPGAMFRFVKMRSGLREQKKRAPLGLEEVDRFKDDIDRFFEKIAPKFSIISVRNKDYLNWRYLSCPNRRYRVYLAKKQGQIKGYLVLREESFGNLRQGYIVEILADPDDKETVRSLVLKAWELFAKEGIDSVETCSTHKGFNEILIQEGFLRAEPVNLFLFSKNIPIIRELLRDKNRWFITRGDMDGDAE